jgi:hypothetical protein
MIYEKEHRKDCKERFEFLCNALNDMRFTLTIREFLKDEIEETIEHARQFYYLRYELVEMKIGDEKVFQVVEK